MEAAHWLGHELGRYTALRDARPPRPSWPRRPGPGRGTYTLPAAHAEVLLDQDSPLHTEPLARPATLDEYARAAGFAGARPEDVTDAGSWRFYRLPADASQTRRTHRKQNQVNSPDSARNTPVSAHCRVQNRSAGW
ncbi:MAG TPA: hypothetical protein VGP36_12785 [Mycobacteriales bacterium]|nr:hypothetical protein [Mycobacteriales bacterium]